MRRISLVGVSGSGKTTIGRRLAASLGVPFIELDAIFHQVGWRDLPTDEFRIRVGDAVAADAWVVDGNYQAVSDLVWDRADTVIWVDLPRFLIMRRLVARTVRRALTGEELWNGNREPLSNFRQLGSREERDPLGLGHVPPLLRTVCPGHGKSGIRGYRVHPVDVAPRY